MREIFNSKLAPYMAGLVEQKRALGYKYEAQVKQLQEFDALCLKQFPNENTVTKEMLDIWGAMKPYEQPGTFRNRVTVISHLAAYIVSLGQDAFIFPTNECPKEPKYIPHIYSEDELRRLFRQIDCCHYSPKVPNRHLIMPVLFRILYCCGLRLGEVLRLEVSDVDLVSGVLLIRESKNGNDRYVPMSKQLTERCRNYAEQVHGANSAHKYFFPAPDGGMIPGINIYTNFRKFLHKAGISHGGRGKGPRIYDFRHTFAVHSLKRIVLSGKNLAVYHQVLKTYMGHSFFKYTAYYLQLTKDMFPDIRMKVEAHYNEMFCAGGDGHD